MLSIFKGVIVVLLLFGILGLISGSFVGDSVFVVRLLFEKPPVTLPVPVAGVRPRDLQDTWGALRGGGRTHKGIDIFAPKGTPVYSTTRGIVVRTGQNRLGGNVVWALGPGRHVHYYAHFERIASIRAGDIVQPGDLLGYVGNTGNARTTPCHLHYGIYLPWGGAINPYPLLAGH
ncbi:M23 family metallopeptidase [Methylocaldum sp.]|uniref:M23 family metallopeptidase n=1 Tax=Methylocaldum sp. TaxID=1969727 RepID=UPI002D278592|nr:M23 family metallopeptidase [Methylocaldum sp.]HYE36597.1 M23 family metallopeptidase [Methylocaldum sp.]